MGKILCSDGLLSSSSVREWNWPVGSDFLIVDNCEACGPQGLCSFHIKLVKSLALAHREILTSFLFPSRNDAPLLSVFLTSGSFRVCVHWKPRAEDAGEESQGGRRTSSDGTRLHSGSGNVYWADHGTPAAGTGGNWGSKLALLWPWFSKAEVSGHGSFRHTDLLCWK